ncbi:MAG: hypothetical protein GX947_02480 [Tissierellia bacterium]|nr:hypothetical protein [Tissierellia bacterium]
MKENKSLNNYNGADLTPLHYNDDTIITTKMLAEVYGTEETNIRTNFNNNKQRFKEGNHYYKLEGAELKAFKANLEGNLKFTSKLILWTKQGCLLLISIFDKPITSECVDVLNKYFNTDEFAIPNQNIRFETMFEKLLKDCLEKNIEYSMKYSTRGTPRERYNYFSEYVTQYKVLGYRLDFYFPNLPLIVEYDEDYHKYQKRKDKKRMNNIKLELFKPIASYYECRPNIKTANEFIQHIRVNKGEEFDAITKILAYINCVV